MFDPNWSPISTRGYFRNSKYDNKTAIFHRDGYVLIIVNINVEGKTPNSNFVTFSKVLEKLTKPGFIWQTYTVPFFIWFDQFFLTTRFYAYPGSIDHYDCATIIQLPKSTGPYISIPQFESFQNIKNSCGRPVTKISTVYPVNSRPIIEVDGITQSFPTF